MNIHAITTDAGKEILLKHVEEKVKQFAVIGYEKADNDELSNLLMNSETGYKDIESYILEENAISKAYYDSSGMLTFELILPYDSDFNSYIYGIGLIASDEEKNVLISIAKTPKIAKVSGIGGTFIYKETISGEAGKIIFNNNTQEFATTKETTEGILNSKAVTPQGFKHGLDGYRAESPCESFKNKIINGDFRVWQRGESFINPPEGYIADRWIISSYGGHSGIVKHTYDFFDTDCIMITMDKLSANYNDLLYIFNPTDLIKHSNKKMTLSFWAKTDSMDSRHMTINSDIISISDGHQKNFTENIQYSNEWKKYTHTFIMPEINRKILLPQSRFRIWFNLPIGTFWITQVQLEEGDAATPFEERPIAIEEMLCKRYFEVKQYVGSGATVSNGGWVICEYFPKRVQPTIYATTKFHARVSNFSSNEAKLSGLSGITQSAGYLYFNVPNIPFSHGQGFFVGFIDGSAEPTRLCIDAELW